jgi:hypothetical protein
MLDDHKKNLYPNCKDGQKKARKHAGIAAMEGIDWFI